MGPKPTPVVIDTNVWISALLTKAGPAARVTRQVIRAGLPVFSADTSAELSKALLRDPQSIALWVDVPHEIAAQTYPRDPADDKFIRAALAAASP